MKLEKMINVYENSVNTRIVRNPFPCNDGIKWYLGIQDRENFRTDAELKEWLYYQLYESVLLDDESTVSFAARRGMEKVIEKAIEAIEKYGYIFNTTDLKLHALSYEWFDIAKNLCKEEGYIFPYEENQVLSYDDNLFYRYCDSTFELFVDDLKMDGIDFDRSINHVGRSSRFYVSPYGNMIPLEVLDELIEYYVGYAYFPSNYCHIENGSIVMDNIDDHNTDEWVDAFMHFKELTTEEIDEHFEGYKRIYDSIEWYKDNQFDDFREWLYGNLHWFEHRSDEELKKSHFWENVAYEYSTLGAGLTSEELSITSTFFEKIGDLYGLTDDFRGMGLC